MITKNTMVIPLHCEHLIIFTVGEDFHIVTPKLGTELEEPQSTETGKDRHPIHNTNFFMIDRGQPIDNSLA